MRSPFAIVLPALVAGAAACAPAAHPTAAAPPADRGLLGAVLHPPNVEPDIVLTDTSGRRYSLRDRNRGKVTLLYFGYTHCPDVCPTTMADIAQALRESGAAVRRQVAVVFATVDPHRDRLPVLRRWLDRFGPGFVGLRGSLRQVVADQRAAGLSPSRVEPAGRTVEHSAIVIAYTPDHREHVFYPEGPSSISALKHDLPMLLRDAAYR